LLLFAVNIAVAFNLILTQLDTPIRCVVVVVVVDDIVAFAK